MTTQPPTPETISCDEARTRLEMGRDAFQRAVRNGNITGFYYWGSQYIGIRAQFDAWMSAQAVEATTAANLTTALSEVEQAIAAAEHAIETAVRAARDLVTASERVEEAKAVLPFPLIRRRAG